MRAFSLEGISGGNAVFNHDKLEWFSAQHLARLPAAEIAGRLEAWLEREGLWRSEYREARAPWLSEVIELLKPRSHTMAELVSKGRVFLADEIEYDQKAVKKHLAIEGAPEHLDALGAALARTEPFDQAGLERMIRGLADERGIPAPKLMQAIRVAVTGRAASPGLFETLALIGRERTLARLGKAASFLRESSS